MVYSMQEMTDAWGDWSAKQKGTTKWFTRSTKYDHKEVNGSYEHYLKNECKTRYLNTTFGENRGSRGPAISFDGWYDNKTNEPQEYTFEDTDTKSSSFMWSITEELKLGLSMKADVGVPGIGDVEVTVSTEMDLSSTQEHRTENIQSWTIRNPVEIPVKKSVHCQLVIDTQTYDLDFTDTVEVTGRVAIWYNDKQDGHWLWFIPIAWVFQEIIDNNIISADGYYISGDAVIATVQGVLKGAYGISSNTVTEEFWLRGYVPTNTDVQDDLLAKLQDTAAKKLSDDYPDSSETSSLDSCLKELAGRKFSDQFGYDYGPSCTPTNSLGNIRPVDGMLTLSGDTDLDSQIATQLETVILSGSDLPSWMQKTTTTDITALLKELLAAQSDNEWHYSQFVQSYDAANEDEDSIKCSSVLVYARGSLEECDITANLHIFYFMGVYFDISSPTAATRHDQEGAAFTAAQALCASAGITDETDITTALAALGAHQFGSQYGYGYTEFPPHYPKDETDALLSRNQYLGYFQSRDTTNIKSYVLQHIIQGFNIPVPAAKDALLSDIQGQFESIFTDTQTGVWNVMYLDQTYMADSTTVNPIRANALLMYWYDHKTVIDTGGNGGPDGTVSVMTTYIHFTGVVYELSRDGVAQDLAKLLCKNIPGTTVPESTDYYPILKQDIDVYVETAFKTAFGFAWNADPPKKKAGTSARPIKRLFEFPNLPTDAEIKTKVDQELFKRDSTGFNHCGPEIYDDVLERIQYRAGPKSVKEVNEWYQHDVAPRFSFVDSKQQTRYTQEYALYTFTHGKLTEDGFGGTTVERFYMSYIGVFFMLAEMSDDDI